MNTYNQIKEKNEKSRPMLRNKVGNFQISLWKKKLVFPAKTDFDCEREVDVVRVCIQYSRFDKKKQSWSNQSIWCLPDELRDLAAVLAQLFEEKGEEVSSPSS